MDQLTPGKAAVIQLQRQQDRQPGANLRRLWMRNPDHVQYRRQQHAKGEQQHAQTKGGHDADAQG
jgi:hypothetical protein